MPRHLSLSFAIVALARCAWAQPAAEAPQAVYERAVEDFSQGRFVESGAGFDRLIELVPDAMPGLWQRGIALYYAGRYTDCRAQFEAHRTVNPNDVENAVWHFLCVARAESPEAARAAILPVGPDARLPMRQVYEMFRGEQSPEDVLAAAGNSTSGRFYGHLYLGLYFEAIGDEPRALEHIAAAAADEFAGPSPGISPYMYMVATVHLNLVNAEP
jgi:lipoprotein NlpI